HSVEVIYPASGQVYFERLRRASSFHDRTTLVPRPVRGDGEITVTRRGSVQLFACPLEHGVECYGYRLREDDGRRMLPERLEAAGVRGPAIGELMRQGTIRIEGRTIALDEVSEPKPGQSFAVVMDTRPCAGASRLALGADLLVCEATYLSSEAHEAHEHFNMTAEQAARLASAGGVRRLVLTHFSQRYLSTEPFAVEAAALHDNVIVA